MFLLHFLRAWPDPDDSFLVLGLGRKDVMRGEFAAVPHVEAECLGIRKYDPRGASALLTKIHEKPVDLVHSHLPKANLWALRLKPRHGAPLCVHEQAFIDMHPFYYRWLLRFWRDRADLVMTCSGAARDALAKRTGMPIGKIRAIHNIVDMGRFQRPVEELVRPDVPGLPSDAFVLGYLGRLSAEKGPVWLIRAMKPLRERIPNVHALLIGDGPQRGFLEREARRLGVADHVHFAGYQRDTPRWISLFDINVVPSLTEAFGISASECMAMGKPVVASRVGGLPEFVNHGQTGFLIEPKSVEALVAAIMELRDDERRREIGERAARFIRDNFDLRKIARQIRGEYEALLKRGGVEP